MFQCVSGTAVRRVFSLSAALLVSACSTVATTTARSPAPAPASPFTGFFKNFSTCRSEFDAIEARIAEAGVREASFHVVPGFAYLRTDRMLASFRDQVSGIDDVWEWTRRMRELEEEARDYELMNLGIPNPQRADLRARLADCGRVLAAIELADDANWAKLQAAVKPADQPAAVTEAAFDPAQWQRDYLAPLQALPAGTSMRLWAPKPVEDLRLLDQLPQAVELNVLQYPSMTNSAWRALAERHAPRLWIETASEQDLPAAPAYLPHGLGADTGQSPVYYQIGYTRFGGATLVQITYVTWFKAAASAPAPLEGLIWRVTLDAAMKVLSYDSLRASGQDHRWYPVQPLSPQPDRLASGQLYVAPELAPATGATLRVASGDHQLRRVVPAAQAASAKTGEYELRAYEDLYALPLADGNTRSLFGPDGTLATTARAARPEVPRQTGHHAPADVTPLHLDDPYVLEAVFVPVPQQPLRTMQTAQLRR